MLNNLKWFILGRTWTYRRPYARCGSCGIRTHDSWILDAWPLLTAPSVRTHNIYTIWTRVGDIVCDGGSD